MGTVLPNFPASPISEVQPFTYRDNESYLKQLSRLRDYIRENLQRINNQEIVDIAALRDNINTLSSSFAQSLADTESYLQGLIAGSHDESIAFDPTNGTTLEGLSQVVSNVYDNVRIFAYFAKDLDDMGMTAAEYDAWLATMPVRHMDLAPLYPTLNDTLGDVS